MIILENLCRLAEVFFFIIVADELICMDVLLLINYK